MRIWY